MTVGVGYDVARIGLLTTYDHLGVLVGHHQTVVAVSDDFRGDGLHHLVDAVDGSGHCCILVGDVLRLDKLGDEASVRRNHQLTYIHELRACLCDGDFLAVEVLHLYALEDLM